MNFTHFLITRFNLRNFPNSSSTDYESWVEWTKDRIILFKKYCLPSVKNQTQQDFKWLIYFDKKTPEEFNYLVEDLEKNDFISICYSDGTDDFKENYVDYIRKKAKKNSTWIITTQLDNDDILHKKAIEIIQQNFVTKNKYMISLSSGYVLDLSRNVLSHYYYPRGPFLSIIESLDSDILGILDRPHSHWFQFKLKVWKEIYFEFFNKNKRIGRFIVEQPLWIQIVHGNNVTNNFYRGFPVIKETNLKDFSLDITTEKMSLKELPNFWSYVYWKRYIKSLFVRFITK